MSFKEVEIPADMVEEVNEYREYLLEAVAEYDETLLEKYFEDPNSISKDEEPLRVGLNIGSSKLSNAIINW